MVQPIICHRQLELRGPLDGGEPLWRMLNDEGEVRCSYCGSITPERFLELMANRDLNTEVADWKYGWPHKIYIGSDKFYTIHLWDIKSDTKLFYDVQKAIFEEFGIMFRCTDDGGLGFASERGTGGQCNRYELIGRGVDGDLKMYAFGFERVGDVAKNHAFPLMKTKTLDEIRAHLYTFKYEGVLLDRTKTVRQCLHEGAVLELVELVEMPKKAA